MGSWLYSQHRYSSQRWWQGTVYVLKFQTFLFLFSNKIFVFRAETHKMLVRIANREDPDLGCAVCLCLFGRQLVFKILEHLL